MRSSQAHLEVNPPKVFTARAVSVICAYGLFLCIPVFISLLAVSLRRFGVFTFLYPLIVMAATTFFLPFGFANPYVTRLLRKHLPADDADALIVQVTLMPRVRTGIRALVEDADDIGWLTFGATELAFSGDSIKWSIPFDQIKELKLRNVGLRGLFVYQAIALKVPALANVQSIHIAERASCLMPNSRRITKQLFRNLSARVAGSKPGQTES